MLLEHAGSTGRACAPSAGRASVVGCLLAVALAAPAGAAELTVDPALAAPGSELSIHGAGMPPAQAGRLVIGGVVTGFRVRGDGTFSALVRVPGEAAPGSAVTAVARVGARRVAAVVRVTGATDPGSAVAARSSGEWIRVRPTRVRAGQIVRADGHGFRRRALVRVWLGERRLRTLRASGRGGFRARVRVPAGIVAGRYALRIVAGGRRLVLHVRVDPDTGPIGAPLEPSPAPAKRTPPPPTPAPVSEQTTPPPPDALVAAVGDIACAPSDAAFNDGAGTTASCRQRQVSDVVVGAAPDALLDLGDNQYEAGELSNYLDVYDPTFGRANSVVYPALGNAEYKTPGAQGFFSYFGQSGVLDRIAATATDASHLSSGYYSFDVGAWHLIALNSNCAEVRGCGIDDPQERWLRADLAAHPRRCTLAYWHHSRFNSGALGDDVATGAFWSALYDAHAEVVLGGHSNHHYERFARQNPAGQRDTNGVRQFIVGTGGESHGQPGPTRQAASEVVDYTSYGVLLLTLRADRYEWRFAPEPGGSFTDSGTDLCR